MPASSATRALAMPISTVAAPSFRARCQMLPSRCPSAAKSGPCRCHWRPFGCLSAANMLPGSCPTAANSCQARAAMAASNTLTRKGNFSARERRMEKPSSSATPRGAGLSRPRLPWRGVPAAIPDGVWARPGEASWAISGAGVERGRRHAGGLNGQCLCPGLQNCHPRGPT
jgi:hypothetical protein